MSAAISIAKPSALADGELVQNALAGRETSFEEWCARYQTADRRLRVIDGGRL